MPEQAIPSESEIGEFLGLPATAQEGGDLGSEPVAAPEEDAVTDEQAAGQEEQAGEPEVESEPAAEEHQDPDIEARIQAEVQRRFAGLQASHTKKAQELADDAAIGKLLRERPDILQALKGLGGAPNGQTAQPNANAQPASNGNFLGLPEIHPDVNVDEYQPDSLKVIEKAAARLIDNRYGKILDNVLTAIGQRVAQLEAIETDRVYTGIAGGIPGAKEKQAEVLKFFTDNPKFLADKPAPDRIRAALSALGMSPAQASQAPSRPASANGTTVPNQPVRRVVQSARPGIPAPAKKPPNPQGKSLVEFSKEAGIPRAKVENELRQLLGL